MSGAPPEEDAGAAIEQAGGCSPGRSASSSRPPDLRFLPDPDVAEVAFAGRSNVGKSSLLTRLRGATASPAPPTRPGRTQELNIFDVGGGESGEPLAFRLVDMPGYGFAKAPKDMVRRWKHLVNDYLRGRVVPETRAGADRQPPRPQGRRSRADDDARQGRRLPTAWSSPRPTRSRRAISPPSRGRPPTRRRKHVAAHPEVLVTSAEKGMGIPELRAAVVEAVG